MAGLQMLVRPVDFRLADEAIVPIEAQLATAQDTTSDVTFRFD